MNREKKLLKIIFLVTPPSILFYFSIDLAEYISSLVMGHESDVSSYAQISSTIMVLLCLIILGFSVFGLHLWDKYVVHEVPTGMERINIRILNFPLIIMIGILAFLGYSALNIAELLLIDRTCGSVLIGSGSSIIHIANQQKIEKNLKFISICLYALCVGVVILETVFGLYQYLFYDYALFLIFFTYTHYVLYDFQRSLDLFKKHTWLFIFLCISLDKVVSSINLLSNSINQIIAVILYLLSSIYVVVNFIYLVIYTLMQSRQLQNEK